MSLYDVRARTIPEEAVDLVFMDSTEGTFAFDLIFDFVLHFAYDRRSCACEKKLVSSIPGLVFQPSVDHKEFASRFPK